MFLRPEAGNGTRTRDPNLGKVVLYQLSYSRDAGSGYATGNRMLRSRPTLLGHGGEGNRTPDLLNAIQALSQLSYAPARTRAKTRVRQEPGSVRRGRRKVKK